MDRPAGTTGERRGAAERTSGRRSLLISRRTRRLRAGRVSFTVACRSAGPCAGIVTLYTLQRPTVRRGFRQAAARRARLGRARFRVAAGKRRTIRVRISRRGRALPRKRRSLRVLAIARYRAPNPESATSTFRLKR